MGLSGNGCKWEPTPARAAEWMRLPCRPHPPAHARTHGPTRGGPRSLTSGRFVVGNATLVAVVAAGFGSVALLLVVLIVVILRNRRAARAVDAAPDLRTPLYIS
jgi:hypothetical protein